MSACLLFSYGIDAAHVSQGLSMMMVVLMASFGRLQWNASGDIGFPRYQPQFVASCGHGQVCSRVPEHWIGEH